MVPTATKFRTASGTTTVIRGLEPSDADAVADLARHLSRRAPPVPALAGPDGPGNATLVACDCETGAILGVGRYALTEPGVADVVFAVAHHCRDEGIHAALLHELAEHARANGVRQLTAHVLVENDRTFDAFWHSGYPMTCRNDGGVTFVTLAIGA
jgi:L-amino acid N-acyltransferase YncA